MKTVKWIILPVCLAALAVGLWGADKWLSRADRALLARAHDDWLTVQDALLRHEAEHGYLPESLAALAPRYLRPDQLSDGLWRYDRDSRLLQRSQPVVVRGLWKRRIPLPVDLPPAPVADDAVYSLRETAGRLLVPAGPALAPAPADALVFEGEWYSETTYGWEIRPAAASSRGAYIHTKEGIGNGPGQIHNGIYDFYNIEEKPVYASLAYHVRLPHAGRYYLSGRMWTTGSHCSNTLVVAIDTVNPSPSHSGDYAGQRLHNETPFRWVWTTTEEPFPLTAGDHMIHIYIHEDGIRLDQLALSPAPLKGHTAYEPNLQPNDQTDFAATAVSPLDLTFDRDSLVLAPDCPPRGHLTLRRLREASGLLMVDVYLEDAETGRDDHRLQHDELQLADLPELAFLPLDLAALDLAAMPRREYLLRAEAKAGGKLLASTHIPLLRPFQWEVSGAYDYLELDAPGPLDPGTSPDAAAWTPFACDHFDAFGVLDFGLVTTGNSLHADQWKTIYARTTIQVPADGEYLFKIQSDDQMLLWLDGHEIYRHQKAAPVTRSAARPTIHLTAGPHSLLMRVNQAGESAWQDGRWQASLRIRTPEDRLTDITGN